MMFGQFPEETQDLYNTAAAHPYNPQQDAGILQGTGTGLAEGYEAGGAKLLQLGSDALKGIGAPVSDDFRKANMDLLNSLNPDPKTIGWAGRQLFGLAETVPTLAGGVLAGGPLGGAAAVGAQQGYSDFRMNQDQGLDTTTAGEKAALTGVTSAAGTLLPVGIGKGILSKVVTGAVGNVMFGAGDRAATSALLNERGYPEMAQQYKVLDASSIAADGVMGAAFGGVAALHAKAKGEVPPSQIDAAMMAKNNQNLEVDSAPGAPINPETRSSHLAAMQTATEQLLRGEPVDVSPVIKGDMSFAIDPSSKLSMAHDDFIAALRETGNDQQADHFQSRLDEAQANYKARTGKLAEVVDKHAAAAQDVADHTAELTRIQDAQSQTLSTADQISLVDPISGERLKEIQNEIDDPATNAKRREDLQAQYELVAHGRDWKEIPDALVERQKNLADREAEVTEKLQSRQKDVDRYAKDIAKRAAKFSEKTPEATERGEGEPQPTTQTGPAAEPAKFQPDNIKDIVARRPDMQVPTGEHIQTGVDEHGQPIMEPEIVSAKEALERDSLEDEKTQTTKNVIQAAVNCFMQFGG